MVYDVYQYYVVAIPSYDERRKKTIMFEFYYIDPNNSEFKGFTQDLNLAKKFQKQEEAETILEEFKNSETTLKITKAEVLRIKERIEIERV